MTPYESVEPTLADAFAIRPYCAHGVRLEYRCHFCSTGSAEREPTLEDKFLEAAQAVSTARVAYSTAFLRFKVSKGKSVTDAQAEAQALVETGSELDMALARLEIARRNLDRGL